MDIFSEKDIKGVQEVIKNETRPKTDVPRAVPVKDEIDELNKHSQQIQELIDQIDALPDANARKLMQECIHEILSFYGHGLERIMNIVSRGEDSAAKDIFLKLIEDSFLNGLLLIHDLHPLDLETRLKRALTKVKPYMDSHGGSVEILSLKDGEAKLKLLGSCDGCPSSALTLELGIKEAIEEHCPDLLSLEVEGLSSSKTSQNGTLQKEKGWKVLSGLEDLPNGTMKPILDSGGTLVLICRVKDKLYAYRNHCPACDRPFNNGTLKDEVLSCKLGHGYDVRQAGICTDDPDLHLDPFPLIEQHGKVKISVG